MGEMIFSFRDLYPNQATKTEETSTMANPDKDDQDALNENTNITEKGNMRGASTKNIFLAMGVLIALVVFFGAK